jgi:transposase
MAIRMLLTDDAWVAIDAILTSIKNTAGSPPEMSDRQFIEAVLYLARPGIPWRDLPDEFGHGAAVYNRFRRWEARGIWRQRWERLQSEGCEVATHMFIARTIVRAHQHAAGARKTTAGTRHRRWAALGVAFPPQCTPAV